MKQGFDPRAHCSKWKDWVLWSLVRDGSPLQQWSYRIFCLWFISWDSSHGAWCSAWDASFWRENSRVHLLGTIQTSSRAASSQGVVHAHQTAREWRTTLLLTGVTLLDTQCVVWTCTALLKLTVIRLWAGPHTVVAILCNHQGFDFQQCWVPVSSSSLRLLKRFWFW